jgi:hypothetical protein
VLLDARGRAMDYATPERFEPGASYQRIADGGDAFRLGPPTPLGRTLSPVPDTRAFPSVVVEPFSLRLDAPPGVEALHYTLDGSVPTAADPVLDGPLRIEGPTALRIRGFAGGRAATPVATRQFFVGPLPEAAVVMAALDSRALRDPEIGIVPNNAGRGFAWERVAHVLIFDREAVYFDGDAGLRTHAGNGIDRGRATSFQIRCRPSLGAERLQRDPLEPALAPLPDRLIFDASPVAWSDKLAYDLVAAAGGAAPRSRLGLLHLNGALHNRVVIFEDVDDDFLVTRWGHTDFDLIKGKPFKVKRGDLERLRSLAARLGAGGWSARDVGRDLDLPGILAIHFAILFGDASQGGRFTDDTVQGYLAIERSPGDGMLHAIAWDLDHGFRTLGHNTLRGERRFVREQPWDTRFLPEMAIDHLLGADAEFRATYVRSAERFLADVVASERWPAAIDGFEQVELRWARPRHAGPHWPPSEAQARAFRESRRAVFARARRFFAERPAEVRRHIAEELGLPREEATSEG